MLDPKLITATLPLSMLEDLRKEEEEVRKAKQNLVSASRDLEILLNAVYNTPVGKKIIEEFNKTSETSKITLADNGRVKIQLLKTESK